MTAKTDGAAGRSGARATSRGAAPAAMVEQLRHTDRADRRKLAEHQRRWSPIRVPAGPSAGSGRVAAGPRGVASAGAGAGPARGDAGVPFHVLLGAALPMAADLGGTHASGQSGPAPAGAVHAGPGDPRGRRADSVSAPRLDRADGRRQPGRAAVHGGQGGPAAGPGRILRAQPVRQPGRAGRRAAPDAGPWQHPRRLGPRPCPGWGGPRFLRPASCGSGNSRCRWK